MSGIAPSWISFKSSRRREVGKHSRPRRPRREVAGNAPLDRRPSVPLTLRQVDPLIRQFTLDLIDRSTGDSS